MRAVPLRDVARYAGRLIRSAVADDAELLVTDRNKPLALIVPVQRADMPGPRRMDDHTTEEPAFADAPHDLPRGEREILEMMGREPMKLPTLGRISGMSSAEYALPLMRLEAKRLVRRTPRGWVRV